MNVSISGAQLGGLAFLGLSIGYGYEATDITLDFWSEQAFFTARTLPYIIAVAGIICACLLIIIPSAKTDWAAFKKLNWGPAVGLLILMSSYGMMLEPLGFIVATSLFLIVAFRMLGIHPWWISCIVSVALTLGFWGLMHLLGIYLSAGDIIARILTVSSGAG
jgi:putative tricarboxylic transport membrane protein